MPKKLPKGKWLELEPSASATLAGIMGGRDPGPSLECLSDHCKAEAAPDSLLCYACEREVDLDVQLRIFRGEWRRPPQMMQVFQPLGYTTELTEMADCQNCGVRCYALSGLCGKCREPVTFAGFGNA